MKERVTKVKWRLSAKHLAHTFPRTQKRFYKERLLPLLSIQMFSVSAMFSVYTTINSNLNLCSHLLLGFPSGRSFSSVHPSQCIHICTLLQMLQRKWGYNLCTQLNCPRNMQAFNQICGGDIIRKNSILMAPGKINQPLACFQVFLLSPIIISLVTYHRSDKKLFNFRLLLTSSGCRYYYSILQKRNLNFMEFQKFSQVHDTRWQDED